MRSKIISFVVILLILFAAYFFLPPKVTAPVRNAVNFISRPLSGAIYKVGHKIHSSLSVFSDIANLRKENADQQEKIYTLMKENAALSEVKSQNDLLTQEITVRGSNTDEKLLMADIIGREPTSFLQSFNINQGEVAGVKVGQAVIYDGILVGKIAATTKQTASVTLIISSHSIVQGELQDSRTLGIVKGGLQGLFIDNIPQEEVFKQGEMVITSGLGGDLPKGIIIGKLDKVTSPKSEIYQTFSISTLLDFYHLESVFVRLQ